jgi:hypothetical protein
MYYLHFLTRQKHGEEWAGLFLKRKSGSFRTLPVITPLEHQTTSPGRVVVRVTGYLPYVVPQAADLLLSAICGAVFYQARVVGIRARSDVDMLYQAGSSPELLVNHLTNLDGQAAKKEGVSLWVGLGRHLGNIGIARAFPCSAHRHILGLLEDLRARDGVAR